MFLFVYKDKKDLQMRLTYRGLGEITGRKKNSYRDAPHLKMNRRLHYTEKKIDNFHEYVVLLSLRLSFNCLRCNMNDYIYI